jgi:hypothetical protein
MYLLYACTHASSTINTAKERGIRPCGRINMDAGYEYEYEYTDGYEYKIIETKKGKE